LKFYPYKEDTETDRTIKPIVRQTRNVYEQLNQDAAKNGWPIGFSIGVAVFHSTRNAPSNIDDVLKIADQLMYRVKKSGKNNVIYEQYSVAQQPLEAHHN
jgi:GGDEF domain-containing protein